MLYRSTRQPPAAATSVVIGEAIRNGLAPDGGLYVPAAWPEIALRDLQGLEFPVFAARVLVPFFEGDSALASEIDRVATRAFDFPLILKDLDESTAVLELFHGPTLAFKDFGARFLALCMNVLARGTPLVLVATSGDTGGAVASAFATLTRIPVVVLYPENKISPRQEKQLTTWGPQVRAFAVNGSFDDCQRMVKEAFLAREWRERFSLISANSINIARLLPQMACFAWASLEYKRRRGREASFIIPTGNAGNACGALWARQLGFPIREIIFAHNANKTIPDYFVSGVWEPRPSIATLANAMDVGHPSNFERVLDLFPESQELRRFASAASVSDREIEETIVDEHRETGEVFCPHTATALRIRRQRQHGDWIVVATAHPAKFETVIEPLLEQKLAVPPALASLLGRPSASARVGASLDQLSAALRE